MMMPSSSSRRMLRLLVHVPAGNDHDRQHRGSGASLGRGRQGGQHKLAIRRSRGGPTARIHALADGHGRLYAVMLTAGQVHDIQGGGSLLARVPPMRQLIADKAYDADDVRAFLAAQGTEAVISPMPRRVARPPFDANAYRARHLIARAFCRLKDWRAIASR